MGLNEVVIEGTLDADGKLTLDAKPNLPPGRVQVVLRQQVTVELPCHDPFWQRMQAIWAIPRSPGRADDGGANTLEEVRRAREEWDEHQQTLERRQE